MTKPKSATTNGKHIKKHKINKKKPSHIHILQDAYSAVEAFISKERLKKEAKDLLYIKKHINSLIPSYVHAPTSGSKDVVIKPVKVSFG